MHATIELALDTTIQLLSGPSGSGKTTELYRLRGALRDAGYHVVIFDIDEYVNESSPIVVAHASKLKFRSHHLIYTVPTYLQFTAPGALPYDSRVLPVPVPHVRPRANADRRPLPTRLPSSTRWSGADSRLSASSLSRRNSMGSSKPRAGICATCSPCCVKWSTSRCGDPCRCP